ncbi:hypothetical protein ARMSODRAFT_342094 [Armillaria solidipes]|uniref:Uncharacterized protein n=1 Tax=Armillaria solidipes TaxID=1076256 RepID=A0A2H3BL03_9AGAR|nr:hypothetical protein ARMSODRAFT_342094 [Armillaria solidipes]
MIGLTESVENGTQPLRPNSSAEFQTLFGSVRAAILGHLIPQLARQRNLRQINSKFRYSPILREAAEMS